jgi:hypothetical protein
MITVYALDVKGFFLPQMETPLITRQTSECQKRRASLSHFFIYSIHSFLRLISMCVTIFISYIRILYQMHLFFDLSLIFISFYSQHLFSSVPSLQSLFPSQSILESTQSPEKQASSFTKHVQSISSDPSEQALSLSHLWLSLTHSRPLEHLNSSFFTQKSINKCKRFVLNTIWQNVM